MSKVPAALDGLRSIWTPASSSPKTQFQLQEWLRTVVVLQLSGRRRNIAYSQGFLGIHQTIVDESV